MCFRQNAETALENITHAYDLENAHASMSSSTMPSCKFLRQKFVLKNLTMKSSLITNKLIALYILYSLLCLIEHVLFQERTIRWRLHGKNPPENNKLYNFLWFYFIDTLFCAISVTMIITLMCNLISASRAPMRT